MVLRANYNALIENVDGIIYLTIISSGDGGIPGMLELPDRVSWISSHRDVGILQSRTDAAAEASPGSGLDDLQGVAHSLRCPGLFLRFLLQDQALEPCLWGRGTPQHSVPSKTSQNRNFVGE